LPTWVGDWDDGDYIDQVRKYKVERFEESIEGYKKAPEIWHSAWFGIVRRGFAELKAGRPAVVEPFENLSGVERRDYDAARAILARQEFEISFRQVQHRLGLAHGHMFCANESTVAPVCR
jgi:hypothetical protein